MGKMRGWMGLAVLATVGCADPCVDDGLGQDQCPGAGGSSGQCEPGAMLECACPGGGVGVQTCSPDGASLSACECMADTEGESASATDADTVGSASASGGSGGDCGNGIEEPGECDVGGAHACPEDCGGGDGGTDDGGTADGGTVDGGSGDGVDACDGAPTFALLVPNVGSQWMYEGLLGFAAGNAMCAAQTVPGDDAYHVCDYEELVEAEAKGELSSLPQGTAAWVHRTTMALRDGINHPVGVGSRCVDWTYGTNHISDGEYLEIGPAGAVTYHLDADPFYDGIDTTHTIPGALECGGAIRAIPCCHVACVE